MKTACIHVGTHKTGTKALQVFLSANNGALSAAGIHLAKAGRHPLGGRAFTPGHHVIAWQLGATDESAALDELVAELSEANEPVALLSSEDFHPLHARPAALTKIRAALESAGYATKIIIYLRPQARYAESLYSELSKASFIGDFDTYIGTILREGSFQPSPALPKIAYEYTGLLQPFTEVFGPENVVVRAYRTDRGAEYIWRDFLTVVANVRGGLSLQNLQNPVPIANLSLSFIDLTTRIRAHLQRNGATLNDAAELLRRRFPDATPELLNGRFQLLSFADTSNFVERFNADNVLVAQRYGVELELMHAANIPPRESHIWVTSARHREMLAYAIHQWTT